ncbi:MAG: hypothetical protein M3176_06975 [Chloroflexota bacterium]|nr:hypothetical protein [Chloroflexota bacterium]MDQ6906553.1 hypothetical protein [Chloroflexota bacterium]
MYRVQKPYALVVTVVTLLAWGCPVQTIVAAFGLDERTVADWPRRTGDQSRSLTRRQTTGATTKMATGDVRCCLTTVHWGATRPKASAIKMN